MAHINQQARTQHGHVTRQQLLDLGVPRRTVDNWRAQRWLIRVHAGVYAVGHHPLGAVPRAAAAVLAGGPDAVLSHDSAAALYGLRRWPPRPEISAPHPVRRPGITAHLVRTLTTTDIRTQQGIRTTSPERTIADIAPRLTDRQLARAVDDARLAGWLTPTGLRRLLASCPRAQQLIDPDDAPSRSDWERDFRAFTTKYGLPTPRFNATVAGHEVDVLFPDHKVIVELDSWRFHSSRKSFESDRERDADTAAAGHLTVRLTWRRLTHRPADEANRLHRILNERRGA